MIRSHSIRNQRGQYTTFSRRPPQAFGWHCSNRNVYGRVEYLHRDSGSFVLVLPDFILAYDERTNILGFGCPLSGFFEARCDESLKFNDLLNDFNAPQIHFIVRRMVQVADLRWEWDCLAEFEQNLPHAKNVLGYFTDKLSSYSADLMFPGLDDILGFKIKLMKTPKGPGAHRVTLTAWGTTFGLRKTLNGAIYKPVTLPGSPKEQIIENSDEDIDHFRISVGGGHNFNLAYIPKNEKITKSYRKRFGDAKTVRQKFLGLGYGEQMSTLLYERAFLNLEDEQEVSLRSVQEGLLTSWKNASGISFIPITFRRRLFKNTTFLCFHEGQLFMAKSRNNWSTNATIGLNVNVFQASLAAQKQKIRILREGRVASLYDAVYHLMGEDPKFALQTGNWRLPDDLGMQRVLGALVLLHILLNDRVQPCGMFRDVLPGEKLGKLVRMGAPLQKVLFDVPIPYGVAYRTHAAGFEPETLATSPRPGSSMLFFRVGIDSWHVRYDYNRPVIAGLPVDDDVQEKLACAYTSPHPNKPLRLVDAPHYPPLTVRKLG